MKTEFLEPGRKPVEDIAGRIVAKARRLPSGVLSLEHLMVVVPTAQSGRRLRSHIARTLGAAVPPRVVMPSQLVSRRSEKSATRADELLAFMEAYGDGTSVDVAAQLADVRLALAANALSFADVAENVGCILKGERDAGEVERWKGLAEVEKKFLAALERRGKTDRIAEIKAAIEDFASGASRDACIEEIVVACVLEPLPALRKALAASGLPVTEIVPPPDDSPFSPLRTESVFPSGTAASESWDVARIFASVRPDEAYPALCVADAELFPEMQGSMQAVGLKIHNPSRTRLADSSLGRLVAQIAELKRSASYPVFSAFVRGGDAARWLKGELNLTDAEYAAALVDLDNREAQLLPEKMSDIIPKTTGKLRAIGETVSVALRKKGVREILRAVFSGLALDERDPDAREFAAAASVVNELVDECRSCGAPENVAMEIFARRLDEATYSLEPDEGDVVLTDGWLEIPYLDADELVVAGFQEGCVPESVVGHAFLPDSLRRGLGLPCNESRAARDLAILRLAISCRRPEAVRFSFHTVDSAGDVLKPSRLLFTCADDAELVRRVKSFYEPSAGTGDESASDLPERWRLALVIPPEHENLVRTSPSSLDSYMRCPFTYRLSKTFGEHEEYLAEELDASEFGHLVHDALEAWGQGELRDSEDPDAISAFLSERIDAILGERFGTQIPAIVALQGESAKRRLANFASVQADHRREGWRVVATERKLEVSYGHTRVCGRCDRVDFREATGEWLVIDYKTWDSADRATAYDAKKGEWHSLQLPLYCAMLDADRSDEFAAAKREKILSCYCVIGKTRSEVLFSEPMGGGLVPEAEVRARELIALMERGVFWPPSTKACWRYDFEPWIFGSPADSVSPAWIADQERRLAEIEAARAKEVQP